MEGERPIQDRKTGAKKQLFDAMTNCLICALNKAVLMMRTGASRTELILEVTFEEETQSRVGKEFPTLIKKHIAILEIWRDMLTEPSTQPFEWGGLRHLGRAEKSLGVVIIEENETGLTIVSKIVLLSREILRALTNKRKIHGKALIHRGGSPCRRRTTVTVAHLGSKTHGALFQDGLLIFELRNASSIFMGIDKFVIRAVTQALMPEKARGSAGKLTHSQRISRGAH